MRLTDGGDLEAPKNKLRKGTAAKPATKPWKTPCIESRKLTRNNLPGDEGSQACDNIEDNSDDMRDWEHFSKI